MSGNHIPPTLVQLRLVNIGMVIQFYLTAVGLAFVWWGAFVALMEGEGFPAGIMAWFIMPTLFGILIVLYILFRCLLAFCKFSTALAGMISISCFLAIITYVTYFTIIVPLYLAIPITLYSIAYCKYSKLLLEYRLKEREEKQDYNE